MSSPSGLPLNPQHQIMGDSERGNPPSAVEMMRQLEESVFGSSALPNPPAEASQEGNPAAYSMASPAPLFGGPVTISPRDVL
jgi:hypothetical protein